MMRSGLWIVVLAVALNGCHCSKDDGSGGGGDGDTDGSVSFMDAGPIDAGEFFVDSDLLDPDAACATREQSATLSAVDLVFMFDRSDSMNAPNKWPVCVTGLENFF